jgi:pimeloyl-ACP methyl ester carboxylesterase
VLLLLPDGTRLPVTELPGAGPWTFLVLEPDPTAVGREAGEDGPGAGAVDTGSGGAGPGAGAAGPEPGAVGPGADRVVPGAAGPEPDAVGAGPGGAARNLTRFGRAVVPDLRGRPGWGAPPGGPGFLDLVDDLDQVRTRAGLGRPILVGLGKLGPVALRAAADQPWAWRALVLGPAAAGPATASEVDRLDLPALVLEAEPASAAGLAAVERLLAGLGGGPGWSGIAPDAPPR